jgi:hypothetical protein
MIGKKGIGLHFGPFFGATFWAIFWGYILGHFFTNASGHPAQFAPWVYVGTNCSVHEVGAFHLLSNCPLIVRAFKQGCQMVSF